MHLWGYERGIGVSNVITFPFAAVFSAFGILTTDMIYRYHKGRAPELGQSFIASAHECFRFDTSSAARAEDRVAGKAQKP